MNTAKLMKIVSALPAALFCLAGAPSAQAQTTLIDPNFVVCALGTVDITSCGPQDPQQITAAGVTVGMHDAAGSPAYNPFLLIVAAPNTGSPIPPIPGASWITADTTSLYGSRPTDPTGLVAGPSFTGGDLYSYLNLITSTPASMNFVNMSGGESLAGLTTPTSFSIYEFIVTVPTAAVGATLNLPAQFNIPLLLQLGDYVAGWDLASNNHFYATPFTTAGLVTTTSSTSSSGISSTGSTSSTSSSSGISSTGVPEPNSSSLALLGLGLLAASFWVRRRTQL